MNNTPKALRLHIAIFGRTNVGKSSFLNMIVGQDVSITSEISGTTTDVVEKTMELLPLGPVVFLDTAGLDDIGELGKLRVEKSKKIFDRTDLAILVVEPNIWTEKENEILEILDTKKIPTIIAVTKIDIQNPSLDFKTKLKKINKKTLYLSSTNVKNRNEYLEIFREYLTEIVPNEFLKTPSLLADLIRPGALVILVVPIDLEAPKGRLILPQVQMIRDILDNDAISIVVKEREYRHILENLKQKPALVICDSQVVLKVASDTPDDIKFTTFSILFSRLKGDFDEFVRGAKAIDELQDGDKILISEACSHHVLEDDIGRVKIPRWIKQYTGLKLHFDVVSGKDYPENLENYKLIVHCGGCMINRNLMLSRIEKATDKKVYITNYGMAIAKCQGVLGRVVESITN